MKFDHFEKMAVYSITYKTVIYSWAWIFIATDLFNDHKVATIKGYYDLVPLHVH